MTALALAGAALLALGGIVTAFRLRPGLAVQAAGLTLLGVAGAGILLDGGGFGPRIYEPFGSSFESSFREGLSPALGLDPLSAFFLTLLALTGVPTLIYARAYFTSRAAAALCAPFLLALAGVLAARDVSTFLAFWELMTLVPAAAILVLRRDAAVRSTVYAYIAITHLGGAGVWIALLALAAPGELSAAAQTLVAIAALVGFGTKAGLVPLHSWLPRAHPVAPAPFSALMSGLMVKVALYGLIRVEFEWLDRPPRWLGLTLLAAGLVSALGGVIWALMQSELKRLLAFSTIENVGIVVIALGASILLSSPAWSALAFSAALLHCANHAVFKVLLFLGAGAFERATGGLELDRLGGLLRQMPWTGAAFGVGCLAIAGLPPLNGFASEWLILQSLTHLAFDGPAGVGLAGAAALAGVAATAALALLCFVNVAGLVLLGRSRRETVAIDAPLAMRAALVFLAGLCVIGGLVPGLLLVELPSVGPSGVGFYTDTPGLALPGTGGLPGLPLLLALAAVTALLVHLRGSRRAAQAPSWACGQPVTPALNWTSAGFTKPLRLVLETLLRPRRELEVVREGGIVQRIHYTRAIGSPTDRLLYRPVIRTALAGAAVARRLQTGNVRTYAAYLLALVLALLALVRAGAFG